MTKRPIQTKVWASSLGALFGVASAGPFIVYLLSALIYGGKPVPVVVSEFTVGVVGLVATFGAGYSASPGPSARVESSAAPSATRSPAPEPVGATAVDVTPPPEPSTPTEPVPVVIYDPNTGQPAPPPA